MAKVKPQNAVPLIQPTCSLVNPNSSVHEPMAAPRMAKLMAVTIKAKQLALNKREALGEVDMGKSPQRPRRRNELGAKALFGKRGQN